MIPPSSQFSSPNLPPYRWVLRVFLLALAGVFLLTLYPFHFEAHLRAAGASPFLLQGSHKAGKPFDDFLNILLFVPYGFGVAGLLSRRCVSWWKVCAATLAAGAFLSYSVEFLQFFIPGRNSSWRDLSANSTGALIGAALLLILGSFILRMVQHVESAIEPGATPAALSVALLAYFGFCFALSGHFQRATSVRTWDPDSYLYVGAYGYGTVPEAWSGAVARLEFWDHPLADGLAVALTSGQQQGDGAFADYRFAESVPIHDERGVAPDLIWRAPPQIVPRPSWDGKSWLSSQTGASGLVEKIAATGKFSVRIRFTPARTSGVDATLLSLITRQGASNLELQQRGESLSLWFRTRVPSPYVPTWIIPKIAAAGQTSDFLLSYDGANYWAYVNGRALYPGYRLGPPTELAASFGRSSKQELQFYRVAFYGVLFFPAGALLAFTRRSACRSRRLCDSILIVGLLVPALALELLLVHIGGQPVSGGNILLGVFMSVCGCLWMNVEGPALQQAQKISQAL
jgi:VanZ family protein